MRLKKVVLVLSVLLVAGGLSILLRLPQHVYFKAVRWYVAAKYFGKAESYDPACQDDSLCDAWANFRRSHPFPYQAIQSFPIDKGDVAIIISEPPPTLSKAELDSLVRVTFGNDLHRLARRRWALGPDGWLEDMVFEVSNTTGSSGTLEQQHALRSRLKLLELALFGTTFSANSDEYVKSVHSLPNLQINASEIEKWMLGDGVTWFPLNDTQIVDAESAKPLSQIQTGVSWAAMEREKKSGGFVSNDGSLVLFTFPKDKFAGTLAHASLDEVRPEFRKFAVSSDIIVGALWSDGGQVGILARKRLVAPDVMPPLRFETFLLLARQNADTLSQSYERNNPYAGKLEDGPLMLRDWAPIYLSDSLINTELGALLNVTDQMLKSWSQAGNTQYLYFNYPFLPPHYVFGKTPLSEKVAKESPNATGVLFNWNTSGAAAIVSAQNRHILVAHQTGALPVTYGANASERDSEDMQDLVADETHAYEYFAALGDPNLERVVQYTLIYQLFRAIAGDVKPRDSDAATMKKVSWNNGLPLSGGMQVLVNKMTNALMEIKQGKYCTDNVEDNSTFASACDDYVNKTLLPVIKEFSAKHPGVDSVTLARLIIAPRDEELALYKMAQSMLPAVDDFEKQLGLLSKKEKVYKQAYLEAKNEADAISAFQAENDAQEASEELAGKLSKFNQDSAALKDARDELNTEEETLLKSQPPQVIEFESQRQALRDAEPIGALFKSIASLNGHRSEIFEQFADANRSGADASIKTPTVVVSWDEKRFDVAVGGHDLNARALRLEESSNTPSLSLVETSDGLILRYNPNIADSVSAHAAQLARAVEHDGVDNPSELMKIVGQPSAVRPRTVALEMKGNVPETTTRWNKKDAWSARVGQQIFRDRKAFVENLRHVSEENDCCMFIAQDDASISYVAEDNYAPPPLKLIIKADDTPSLLEYLGKRSSTSKPLVFLNASDEHVQALALSLDAGSDEARFSSLAEGLGSPPARNGSVNIMCKDMRGHRRLLSDVFSTAKKSNFEIFKALFTRHEATAWRKARFRIMTKDETSTLLGSAWDASKDGAPHAINVHLDVPNDARGVDFEVVAGSASNDYAQVESDLLRVHVRAQETVPNGGAHIAAFYESISSEVAALPHESFRRLALVVHNGDGKALYTEESQLESLRRAG